MTNLQEYIHIPATEGNSNSHPVQRTVDLLQSQPLETLSFSSLLVLHGLFESWYSDFPEITGIESVLLYLKNRIFDIFKDPEQQKQLSTLNLKMLVYVKRLFLLDWIAQFQGKVDRWTTKQNGVVQQLSNLFFSISSTIFEHDRFLKELSFTIDELQHTLLLSGQEQNSDATLSLMKPSEWDKKLRLEIQAIQQLLDWEQVPLLKQIDALIRQIYDYNELVDCVSIPVTKE